MLTYAQNAEDLRLRRALADVAVGRYVDVGAADPDANSVTRLFYDLGWTGLNIEPGPKFDRLSAERPRDVNLRLALGERDETDAVLYVTHPYSDLSSLDKPDLEALAHFVDRVEQVPVQVRTMAAVLDEFPSDCIHFLKVDVEGAEDQVLRSNDWNRHRPWIVVVEAITGGSHLPNHDRWEPLLLANGYSFAYFDGINRFYVERDQGHRSELLAAPIWPTSDLVGFDHRQRLAEVSETADREHVRLLNLCQALQRELGDARTHAVELSEDNARWYARAQSNAMAEEQRAVLAARVTHLEQVLRDVYVSHSYRLGNSVMRPAKAVVDRARSRRGSVIDAIHRTEVGRSSPQELYTLATAVGRAWHFATRVPGVVGCPVVGDRPVAAAVALERRNRCAA